MPVRLVGMSPQVYRHMFSHKHDVWEIVLNLQGSGYTEIGGRSYAFGPGSIICQPPLAPHNKSSEEGFRDIFIQPTAFSLAGAVDENGVLLLQDDGEHSFETLMLLAHRVFHKKDTNYQSLLNALFEAMDQLLISWHRAAPEGKGVEQLKNRIVGSFADSEFSVAQLLEDGPYCGDHMRRRFKRATGRTPLEYLTELRIEYAKKLLRENGLLHYSVAEIGAMSGYYDHHYFSRIFKKKTGYTPAAYQMLSEQ